MDVEEEKRKKIEILLKTTLAPKKFIKQYGVKDGNKCTICLEDFKIKKSNVSVTTCQHVFHYKCLSNWLIQNVLNPKCPNCNYNLILDVENNKTDNIQTIDISRRPNENNIETQDNNQNIGSNENRFITRNATRSRSRRTNHQNGQSVNNNIIENSGNPNGVQEVVIENI